MKNILYVHSGDDWIAGSEKVFLSLMERLPRELYRPYLICDQPAMAEAARRLGVAVQIEKFHTFLLDYHGKDWNPFAYLSTVLKVNRWMKRWKIDLVHVTNANPAQIVVPAARWRKIPVVCHVQTRFFKRSRVGSLVSSSDKIIPVSEGVAADYRGMKRCRDKVKVVYNAVDFEIYASRPDRVALKKEWGFGEGDLMVGTVAYLIPRKGVDTLIEAIAGLPEKFRCVIAGEGPSGESLKQMIFEKGLGDRVKMLGLCADVPRVLGGLDVFCLLSHSDPLPYSVIEAAASGVPVVASNVDGVREIVEDGVEGVLVPPREPDAARAAIERLGRDPELRRKMGEAGRKKVRERFSYEKHLNEIFSVYEELL